MKITSSYDVQIVGINKMLKPTVTIYQEALALLIDIYDKEWDFLQTAPDKLNRKMWAEHLIHNTKQNTAKYSEFDSTFKKMPSYFRRSVVNKALGCVSSYHSNLKNWEKNGKIGNPPKLQVDRYELPVFYRDNAYKETENPDMVQLKLFIKNDWVWQDVKLRHTDVEYLHKYWSGHKASAPIMERRYNKYYLRFAFEEEVIFLDADINSQKVLSVDLGINGDATCSVMRTDGTILAREFINFASDKDRMYHTLNKIKKKQRKHQSVTKLWLYAKNCNEQHAIKIANAIINLAVKLGVYCIVFEYLDFKGKTRSQKISMWRKQDIQKLVEHKAHRCQMHIAHVNAKNTSALAFDGSGEVTRDKDNYSLCTFKTKKQYNCDLNASYNIGARYFIRNILKPLPATAVSQLEAKVPLLAKRTQCTLSTLINLNAGVHSLLYA